jgi:hypothetical protein
MIRKLLVLALSAALASMACLGIAWGIGGDELVRNGGYTIDLDGEGKTGPHVRKLVTFDPGVPLVLNAPVSVEFTRGDRTEMAVSGNAELMKAMRWDGGTLTLGESGKSHEGTLTLRITAPAMPRVELNGPGNIVLNGLDQPVLDLDIGGAGNVEASGKVGKVMVSAAGAGNLDLEDLIAGDGEVDMAGFGNADLSVTGKLDVSIAGAGNVTLHRKPRELHSDIAGLGKVSHDY